MTEFDEASDILEHRPVEIMFATAKERTGGNGFFEKVLAAQPGRRLKQKALLSIGLAVPGVERERFVGSFQTEEPDFVAMRTGLGLIENLLSSSRDRRPSEGEVRQCRGDLSGCVERFFGIGELLAPPAVLAELHVVRHHRVGQWLAVGRGGVQPAVNHIAGIDRDAARDSRDLGGIVVKAVGPQRGTGSFVRQTGDDNESGCRRGAPCRPADKQAHHLSRQPMRSTRG